jgi:hypothetical protein
VLYHVQQQHWCRYQCSMRTVAGHYMWDLAPCCKLSLAYHTSLCATTPTCDKLTPSKKDPVLECVLVQFHKQQNACPVVSNTGSASCAISFSSAIYCCSHQHKHSTICGSRLCNELSWRKTNALQEYFNCRHWAINSVPNLSFVCRTTSQSGGGYAGGSS